MPVGLPSGFDPTKNQPAPCVALVFDTGEVILFPAILDAVLINE